MSADVKIQACLPLSENPLTYWVFERAKEMHVIPMLGVNRCDVVLDVGSGLGYFTTLISSRAGEVCAIDIDIENLKFARQFSDAKFIQADAQHLPFRDNSFTKVLMSDVIEHLPDDRMGVREAVRVAKSGATLVLTTAFLDGLFAPLNFGHSEEGPEQHLKLGYGLMEITDLLLKAAAKVVEIRYTKILFSKVLVDLTMLIYLLKYRSLIVQSQLIQAKKSPIFRLYRRIFPLLHKISRFDEPLSRFFRGEEIIIKARVLKEKEGYEEVLG